MTIYHESSGRLGNQLFQYASMHGIAQKQNATLCVTPKYSWYSSLENERNIQYFNELRESFTIPNMTTCSVPWTSNHISGDGSNILLEQQFDNDIEITGSLETFYYFDSSISSSLRFNSNITQYAKEYLQQFQAQINIGIHVRFYETSLMKTSNQTYFLNAMSFFERKFPGEKIQFIVTSDNIEKCKYLFEFSNFNIHFVQENHTAAIDMAILAHCNHIIISSGTFTWWSAFLCESISRGIVVYDKNVMGDWGSKPIYDSLGYYYPKPWVGME